MKSLSLTKPHMLVMAGIPSSGKSFFAEKFSETFGAPYVNHRRLLEIVGDKETAATASNYMLEEMMKTRQSLIFEGTADTRKERAEVVKIARDHGYEPLFIWVQIDKATASTRATKTGKGRTNRVLSAGEHEHLMQRFKPLIVTEKHVVISGKHTYASQAKVVLTKLSAPRAELTHHSRPADRPGDASTPDKKERRNIQIG